MSDAPDSTSRPPFRPAEVVTVDSADASLASGDTDQICFALIDGSRCLDDEWGLSSGERFLKHQSPRVRWAALFALDQARAAILSRMETDFEIVFQIGRLAWEDANEDVRNMAVTTLVDIIGQLTSRSP